MRSPERPTIVARSSPPGPGLRGILRVSGPGAESLAGRALGLGEALPRGRAVLEGRFRDGEGDQPVRLLWMPGPRSYTREDVAEFHLPGSPPLLQASLDRLLDLGAVLAQPGEFTRRAFENGALDLLRAEGVLALIEARDQEGCRAAHALLEGGLGDRVSGLRDGLDELRALCEASLDFDETDTGHVDTEHLLGLGRDLRGALDGAVVWERRRDPPRGESRVVLAGAPNAGKSTLFNALVGDERALVSDLEGTTRDALTAELVLGGVRVRLHDSPGIEAGRGEVETSAQRLADRDRRGADLVVWVVRADGVAVDAAFPRTPGNPEEHPAVRLLVWSQVDRPGGLGAPPPDLLAAWGDPKWVAVSAVEGRGVDELAAAIPEALGLGPSAAGDESEDRDRLQGRVSSGEDRGVVGELQLRHLRGLVAARDGLVSALEGIEGGLPLDLCAEELRRAGEALDELDGSTTPEDLLDRIFARFCLGK